MYLPAYVLIRQCLQTPKDQTSVTIPRDVFCRLLELMAVASGFDEEWYSSAYDDVARALEIGLVKSALSHYSAAGYFEGRRPRVLEVDEDWYQRRYPDVARGIEEGSVASAHAHYNQTGYFEGRVPNATGEHEIEEWNSLIQRHVSVKCMNG